jgi:SAM-dependent methyltransferase
MSSSPNSPLTQPAPSSVEEITLDWGIGRYEMFAAQLQTAADRIVKLAHPRPGEEVLDIGCGTGNAALLAARAGATVTGLDLSPRLLEVARTRATAEGLDAAFVAGDAQALPFEDCTFDLVLSVFGIIFAADAQRAVSEALRVLAPEGRALISAWEPDGAVQAMAAVITDGVSSALGFEIPTFPWHDQAAIAELAASLGATAALHEGEVVFCAESPESYLAIQEAQHPLAIQAWDLLQHAGTLPAVRQRALEALRRKNEDPGSFRATSRYRVIELRHPIDPQVVRGSAPLASRS